MISLLWHFLSIKEWNKLNRSVKAVKGYSGKHGYKSSVGIANVYWLDGPGIESRWEWDFPHSFRPPWGTPSLIFKGYRVIPGGKRLGRGVNHLHPCNIEAEVWISNFLLCAFMAFYKGDFYLFTFKRAELTEWHFYTVRWFWNYNILTYY